MNVQNYIGCHAWRVLLAVVLTLVATEAVRAQSVDYPNGVARTDQATLNRLAQLMRQKPLDATAIAKTYFGDTYDTRLADLIVVVGGQDNSIRMGLTAEGENAIHLYGQPAVWVLVLADTNLNQTKLIAPAKRSEVFVHAASASAGAPLRTSTVVVSDTGRGASVQWTSTHAEEGGRTVWKDSIYTIKGSLEEVGLNIKRDVLATQEEPSALALSNIVSIISNLLSKQSFTRQSRVKEVDDESERVSFNLLGRSDGTSIYVASARFELVTNTLNRVVVYPKGLDPVRHANINFVNAERTFLGAGFGFGYARAPKSSAQIFAGPHLRLIRPLHPADPRTVSLWFGFAMTQTSILESYFGAVRASLGYLTGLDVKYLRRPDLFGDTGVFIGATSFKNAAGTYRWGLAVGFDTTL